MQIAICSWKGINLKCIVLPFSTWTCTIHLYSLHFVCLPPPGLWKVPDGQFWFCLATEQNPQTSPRHCLRHARAYTKHTVCVISYFNMCQGNNSKFFPNKNTSYKSSALSTSSLAIVAATIPAVLSVTIAAIYTKVKRDQPIRTPIKHTCFLGKT